MSAPQRALCWAVALVLGFSLGCVAPGARRQTLHVSEVAHQGDPARRASVRVVMEGLESEQALQTGRALSQYESAIRIDPTNPIAYLALARHYLDEGDPERSLVYLDQAQTLLAAEGSEAPRLEAHLLGLRGAALRALGRDAEAAPLLARARRLAPSVWNDEQLSPAELR